MSTFIKSNRIDISIAVLSLLMVMGCCLMFSGIKKSLFGEHNDEIVIYFEKQNSPKTQNLNTPKRNVTLKLQGQNDGAYEIGLIQPNGIRENQFTQRITAGKTIAVSLSYKAELEHSLLFVKKGEDHFTFYTLKEEKKGEYQAKNIELEERQFEYSHSQKELAFVNEGNIWKVATDGSSLTQLTRSGKDQNPRWSPNDFYLAFASTRDGNSEIYMMDEKGNKAVNLTESPHDDENPAWAPDGLKIAFNSNRVGVDDIFIVYTESKRTRQLTKSEAAAQQPIWSPNGDEIAFLSSDWKGTQNLYSINFGGRKKVKLSSVGPGTLGDESFPVWISKNEIKYTNQWNNSRESLSITAQNGSLDITSFIAFRALIKTFSL